jgi:Skp family chaperone for outer membrane proteins
MPDMSFPDSSNHQIPKVRADGTYDTPQNFTQIKIGDKTYVGRVVVNGSQYTILDPYEIGPNQDPKNIASSYITNLLKGSSPISIDSSKITSIQPSKDVTREVYQQLSTSQDAIRKNFARILSEHLTGSSELEEKLKASEELAQARQEAAEERYVAVKKEVDDAIEKETKNRTEADKRLRERINTLEASINRTSNENVGLRSDMGSLQRKYVSLEGQFSRLQRLYSDLEKSVNLLLKPINFPSPSIQTGGSGKSILDEFDIGRKKKDYMTTTNNQATLLATPKTYPN